VCLVRNKNIDKVSQAWLKKGWHQLSLAFFNSIFFYFFPIDEQLVKLSNVNIMIAEINLQMLIKNS
jgi:hypothetical protein